MGKAVHPKDTIPLIVKGTCLLKADAPAVPAPPDEQLPPTGDCSGQGKTDSKSSCLCILFFLIINGWHISQIRMKTNAVVVSYVINDLIFGSFAR